MSINSSLSRSELDDRIAIARDNIRQLIEQAAAASGAEDETRNAERLAQQNDELQRLIAERDALPPSAGARTAKLKAKAKAKAKAKPKSKPKSSVKAKKAAKKKAKPAAKKKKKR
jgi:hypothetical protein